jgi:hypothetical protein
MGATDMIQLPQQPYSDDGKYNLLHREYVAGLDAARVYRSFREGFLAGYPKATRELISEDTILSVFRTTWKED